MRTRAGFSQVGAELPTLGVGASSSFGVEPDPVALCASAGGPAFLEYSGPVQTSALGPAFATLQQAGVPFLYHPSCLNLCGPWENPKAWLRAIDAHLQAVSSPWLAQDVAICFVGDEPGYSVQLGYFVPPILTADSLAQAIDRVHEVRDIVSRPLLLEPAPVTFDVGDMDPFVWLGRLAEATDCGLLLDAGHIVSHQLAAGRHRELAAGLDALDLSRVIELHVAGGVIREHGDERAYLDAHDLPVLPETWWLFGHLLSACPALRAVCVECEGMPVSAVLNALSRTRRRVVDAASNLALAAHAQSSQERST